MQDKYAQMQRFFTACDELISGKYILADNKISEVLKAIAASEELTGLFTAVTERFDYPAAKQAYLRYPAEPGGTRGARLSPRRARRSYRLYLLPARRFRYGEHSPELFFAQILQ